MDNGFRIEGIMANMLCDVCVRVSLIDRVIRRYSVSYDFVNYIICQLEIIMSHICFTKLRSRFTKDSRTHVIAFKSF